MTGEGLEPSTNGLTYRKYFTVTDSGSSITVSFARRTATPHQMVSLLPAQSGSRLMRWSVAHRRIRSGDRRGKQSG